MWLTLLALAGKIPATAISLFTGIDYNAMFGVVKAHWQIFLGILVSGLLLGATWGWDHDHKLLVSERTAHALDIKNFKDAQAEADTKAQQERDRLQQESKASANQADSSYTALLAKYRSSILRYKAGQSASGKANHNQLPASQGGDGPSASTDISISLADADICAINTGRLKAVHDWAINAMKGNQ